MDPTTDERHYILDLNWQGAFGFGYRAVVIESETGGVFLTRFAELLASIVDESVVMVLRRFYALGVEEIWVEPLRLPKEFQCERFENCDRISGRRSRKRSCWLASVE